MKKRNLILLSIAAIGMSVLSSCAKNELDGYRFYNLIEEVKATCLTGGMKAHYESDGSNGKVIYLDTDKKIIDFENLIIPATGHKLLYVGEFGGSCTESGVPAHYHCENCNCDFEDDEGLVPLTSYGHGSKGHVMNEYWTMNKDSSKVTHYHACARENCDHYEDEVQCVFDREVIKDEYKVSQGVYAKSCVCGRKSPTLTFNAVDPSESAIDVDQSNWQELLSKEVGLSPYNPGENKEFTLNDVGIANSGFTKVPNQSTRKWMLGNFDMSSKDEFDFVFRLKYEDSPGKYIVIYFGNSNDSDGLQFRLMLNRSVDGGYVEGYCYSVAGGLMNSDDSPFINECSNKSYFVTRPMSMDENGYEVRFKFTQTSVNNYKFVVSINGYDFKKTEGDAETLDLNVKFPDSYFTNSKHRNIRIDTTSETAEIKDFGEKRLLIVKDMLGNYIGFKDFMPIKTRFQKMPYLAKKNSKFIGWFMSTGDKFTNETIIEGMVEISPRFIDIDTSDGALNITLKDLNIDVEPTGFISNRVLAGVFNETHRQVPVNESTNNVNIYFLARFTFSKIGDDYFQFGVPFDYTDSLTRNVFRINAHKNVSTFEGYIGHSSTIIGPHGSEGSKFETPIDINETSLFMVHIQYKEGSNIGLQYMFELISLANGDYAQIGYDNVRFISSNEFSFTNPYRNYICIYGSINDASIDMANAW